MRRVLGLLTALVVLLTPAAAIANPISAGFADTFADPVIVRGDDGLWYAYGTTDPLREGERVIHRIPIARSSDLVDWAYVGDAFSCRAAAGVAAANAAFWAPDVRRVGDRWVMYVTVTETTVAPGASAIGAATAPTPAGPVDVRRRAGGRAPAQRRRRLAVDVRPGPTDHSGRHAGTSTTAATSVASGSASSARTALRITGPATRVAIDNKFEGAYVVRRDGWYYLFASSANCCAGPTTGYSVSVGRARDPRGPYVDRLGRPLNASRAGGTPVIAPNGNRWVGTGHNGLITDLAGQDWLVYHAIDRDDPYLDEPFGINERPMLLDRLDWIGGWPTVRAGALGLR